MFCDDDANFGPQTTCRDFDFTTTFENGILSIVPTGLFLLLTTVVLFLSRNELKSPFERSLRSYFAWFASFAFFAGSVVALAAWIIGETAGLPSAADTLVLAALALDVAASLVLLGLTATTLQSQGLAFFVSLYLIVSLILNTARIRTFYLTSPSTFFFAALCAAYAARFLTFVGFNLKNRERSKSYPEEAGFLSHILVLWAFPLLWKGKSGNLGIEDLPELQPEMAPDVLYKRFETVWEQEKAKTGSDPRLIRTLFFAFYPTILGSVPAAILRSLTQVVQPVLVHAALNYIESYTTPSPEPDHYGWALVGAFAIVCLGLAAGTSQYFYYVYRTGAYIRGACVEAIYRKTLKLRADGLEDASGGDPMNLMSVDIERITLAIDPLHQLWSSLIVIAIGLFILYSQLGASFVAAVIVTAIVMIITPILSRHIDDLQDAWSAQTDTRVRFISGVLHQIKGVKLGAYEPELFKKILNIRGIELAAMKRFWKDFSVVVCVTNTALNMLSLFTLGTYAVVANLTGGASLDTARLFTSYTVISIIAAPLFSVGQNYGTVLAAYSSLKRIETYLLSGEIEPTSYNNNKTISEKDATGSIASGDDEKSDITATATGGAEGDLELKNATVGWKEKVVLSEMNATVRTGKFTMVIGRVATGKTTLLVSLLRESTLIAGSIVSPHAWKTQPIAYCSQAPWLQSSMTIQQNILFASSMDSSWYQRVLKACALDIDLTMITGGDSARAKGLSGGQKARIALARAVYSKSNYVILDDVFAALDATTSAHVFRELFGKEGLLRGKTVVMATNQLYHLREADWIFALADGHIVEQGTYSELSASESAAGTLIRDNAIASEHSQEQGTVAADSQASEEELDKDAAAQEEIDAIQTGTVARKTYLHYAFGAGYRRMAIYLVFLVITVAIQIITPVYLQFWAAANDGTTGEPQVGRWVGGYAAIEVAYAVAFTVVFYYFIMTVVPEASTNLHGGQLKAVLDAPMSFFDNTSAGKVISRFSQDIFIIDFEFPLAMHDFGYETTRLIGSAALMISAVPYLAAVVALVVLIAYFVQKFYLATSKQLRRLDLASKSPLYTLFQETVEFNGLLTIRAASQGTSFVATNTSFLARSQKPFYLTNISRLWLATTIGLMTALINVLFVLIAVSNRHSTNAGLFGVGLSQAVSLQDIISLVLTSWTQLEIAAVAVERNLEFTSLPAEEPDNKLSDDDEDGDESSAKMAWPSQGELKFDNVIARYKPELDPALKGVSFDIAGGTNMGVCGRTGSGKSTIILALLRALDVEGLISIDGQDTSLVPRRRLRRAVTVVAQDPFVLNGTVRENLDVNGRLTDDELWAICEAVQLKETVSGFEEKLDHPLTSHSLSAGQRQLLALARAALRRSRIVVLDEATAALDVETDAVIQRVLREEKVFREATILTVAHRVATIADYHNVIVMESGKVKEVGDPAVLLKTDGSAFGSLMEAAGKKDDRA